jgi:CheY-like chemotaxis protein
MVEEDTFSIILVDDDPHVCNIFELVMNHNQLSLMIFSEAEQAIQYLQENTSDVVVLDLFLPGLDGYQALDQIRKTALDPSCRVVATTAYYTNDTRQEIEARGFNGYLPKPFAAKNLVAYLQSVADKR